MTAAQKAQALYDKLAAERTRLRGTLPPARWLQVVAEFLAAHKLARKTATPINQMTEPEFQQWLKDNEVFKGIDIPKELGKCKNWCATSGKVFSRRRIVVWLGNADKPFGKGPGMKPTEEIDIYTEPDQSWRDVASHLWPDLTVQDQPWKDIRSQYGRRIIIEMQRRASQ
jgi:hypothetical protein